MTGLDSCTGAPRIEYPRTAVPQGWWVPFVCIEEKKEPKEEAWLDQGDINQKAIPGLGSMVPSSVPTPLPPLDHGWVLPSLQVAPAWLPGSCPRDDRCLLPASLNPPPHPTTVPTVTSLSQLHPSVSSKQGPKASAWHRRTYSLYPSHHFRQKPRKPICSPPLPVSFLSNSNRPPASPHPPLADGAQCQDPSLSTHGLEPPSRAPWDVLTLWGWALWGWG